ncbi:DUF6978 family protein [Neobacillus jeddahensis]|uniref:DUF6978 family protein n=1 Tax=Neobacillus jeddahensis TaxID=1461580 RepID=UPI003709779E
MDVARGRQQSQKATYQTRHHKSTILLRMDIEGPSHDNPDGEDVPCHTFIFIAKVLMIPFRARNNNEYRGLNPSVNRLFYLLPY